MTALPTWSDDDLTNAVQQANSMADVLRLLDLKPSGDQYPAMRRHIARLDLSTSHFAYGRRTVEAVRSVFTKLPSCPHRSGVARVAAWLLEREYAVSWPLEPTAYDLVAESDEGLRRVQVKTGGIRSGCGWILGIARQRYDRMVVPGTNGRRRASWLYRSRCRHSGRGYAREPLLHPRSPSLRCSYRESRDPIRQVRGVSGRIDSEQLVTAT